MLTLESKMFHTSEIICYFKPHEQKNSKIVFFFLKSTKPLRLTVFLFHQWLNVNIFFNKLFRFFKECTVAKAEINKTFKLRHFRKSGRVLNCQLTEVQQKQTQHRGGSGNGECSQSPKTPHQFQNTTWILTCAVRFGGRDDDSSLWAAEI